MIELVLQGYAFDWSKPLLIISEKRGLMMFVLDLLSFGGATPPQESLRKAELARAEAEWLERQVDVVHEAAVSIKDDLEKQSQRQQEKARAD